MQMYISPNHVQSQVQSRAYKLAMHKARLDIQLADSTFDSTCTVKSMRPYCVMRACMHDPHHASVVDGQWRFPREDQPPFAQASMHAMSSNSKW